jgi:MFS family permease
LRRGYLRLLVDHRDFRYLYLARTVSLFGDWFNLLAVLALLREIDGSSARAIGWVLILKLLPLFLLGPVAGVVADRFSRKGIMIASDFGRFAAVSALLLAGVFPQWSLVLVYGLTAAQIGLAAFFEPARTASVPNVVPEEDLGAANALGAITWSAMFTLGSGLGGLVTWAFGWQAAIIIDALSYLVSAWLVRRVRLPRRPRRGEGPLDFWTVTGLRDVTEGASYVLARPRLAAVLLIKTGWGIAGGITLLLTVFGQQVYPLAGSPELGVTLLYLARALGTGLGPVLGRRIMGDDPDRIRRLLTFAFLLPAGCYLLFALTRDPWSAAFLVTTAHLGGSTLWVFSTLLLQREVPDALRGRIFAAELGLATLAFSVSTFVYGHLVDLPGSSPRRVVAIMAVSLLIPASFWAATERFLRRRTPTGENGQFDTSSNS